MSENIENPDNQVEDSTAVGQVDVNIDEIFGMPGAENVMLPATLKKKMRKMLSQKRLKVQSMSLMNLSHRKKMQVIKEDQK